MENGVTLIITGFRNLSSKVYEVICDDFARSVNKLDRQTDENVFQQLGARYAKELERDLEQEAEKILTTHKSHEAIGTLERELAGQIAYLVSAFLLKVNSM